MIVGKPLLQCPKKSVFNIADQACQHFTAADLQKRWLKYNLWVKMLIVTLMQNAM